MLNKRGKGCAIVHFLKGRVELSSKRTDMRTNPHTKYFHNSLIFTSFDKHETRKSDPIIEKCEYTYDSYGNITTMKVNGKVKERYRHTYYKPVKKGK